MSIGSILLILALAVVVSVLVARPFWDRHRNSLPGGNGASPLMAERERILGELLELDFDRQLGKIPEEDYSSLRSPLVQKAAQVLKQLDAQGVKAGQSVDLDDDLERLIAAHKANEG